MWTLMILIGVVVVGAVIALMAVAAVILLRKRDGLAIVLIALVVMGALTGCVWLARARRQAAERAAAKGWVVCAYDGRMIKERQAGAKSELDGEILYFCNENHKQRFMKSPNEYQCRWRAGYHGASFHVAFFNMMRGSEYLDAMRDTGTTVEMPGDTTHHLSVAVMAGPDCTLATDLGVAAELTAPGGAVTEVDLPLTCAKHYAGDVRLSGSGEYEVRVTLSSPSERTRDGRMTGIQCWGHMHRFTYLVR